MKVERSLVWLLAMTLVFATVSAQDEAPADTTVSHEITEEALEELFVLSDTLQARIIKGLAENDMDQFRSLIPDDLGIVLPEGQTSNGKDVKELYWSHVIQKLSGTKISADRFEHTVAKQQGGWVREKVLYEMTVPTSDSTSVDYEGHFLLFWQIEDGQWYWRRLFVARQ